MLPAQSSKPLRVCDCCFHSLSMGKGDFADVDLSAIPNAPPTRAVPKPPITPEDQLSTSRDETTDDSDDDEEDTSENPAEQAQLKDEKVCCFST